MRDKTMFKKIVYIAAFLSVMVSFPLLSQANAEDYYNNSQSTSDSNNSENYYNSDNGGKYFTNYDQRQENRWWNYTSDNTTQENNTNNTSNDSSTSSDTNKDNTQTNDPTKDPDADKSSTNTDKDIKPTPAPKTQTTQPAAVKPAESKTVVKTVVDTKKLSLESKRIPAPPTTSLNSVLGINADNSIYTTHKLSPETSNRLSLAAYGLLALGTTLIIGSYLREAIRTVGLRFNIYS